MSGAQAAVVEVSGQVQASPRDDGQSRLQPAGTTAPEPLLVEDLLVEEVSIDGMCGVY